MAPHPRNRLTIPLPRNAKAALAARAQRIPLFVSFIGDTPWPNPTCYCDPSTKYGWSFAAGIPIVIAVRGPTDIGHAAASILDVADIIHTGYPVLVDLTEKNAACVVEGRPFGLWPIRRGSSEWNAYFNP